MERSTAFDSAGSIERAAQIVTEGTAFFDSDYLAGQYAFVAALEGYEGYGRRWEIDDDTLSAHLDCLAEAGAEFDRAAALAVAGKFLAAHRAENDEPDPDGPYYVIETDYVGPNHDQAQYYDADTWVISTSPATTNMSREVRTEGWCGTTNDWYVHAHGEFPTLDAARAAITERFGDDLREIDPDEVDAHDGDIVEAYKPGQYQPWCPEATSAWVAGGGDAITAETTDEQIAALAVEYESIANSDGLSLHAETVIKDLTARRDELRDEDEDEDEDEA